MNRIKISDHTGALHISIISIEQCNRKHRFKIGIRECFSICPAKSDSSVDLVLSSLIDRKLKTITLLSFAI